MADYSNVLKQSGRSAKMFSSSSMWPSINDQGWTDHLNDLGLSKKAQLSVSYFTTVFDSCSFILLPVKLPKQYNLAQCLNVMYVCYDITFPLPLLWAKVKF